MPQKKKKKKAGGVVGGATEVLAKPTRRTFTLADKVRILEAIDTAAEGQKGSVLRQEGIYHSHLQKWRKELAREAPKQRDPKAVSMAQENRKLKAKLAAAEKKLAKANQIIDLQKKVSELLGVALAPIDQGEDKKLTLPTMIFRRSPLASYRRFTVNVLSRQKVARAS